MSSFSDKIQKIWNGKSWKWPVATLAIGLTLVSLGLDLYDNKENVPPKNPSSNVQIDTLIPSGHTLIPIEVLNFDSVNAVLGFHGVVDIYSPGQAEPVARAIKITRAPRDPSQLSLLVPIAESSRIVRAQGPFKVVIRNPKSTGTEFVKQKSITRRRVLIGQGER